MIRFFAGGVRRPSDEPRACHLERVEFVQGDSVDLTQPSKGTCICRFEGSPRREVCLRLETELRLASQPDRVRDVKLDCYPTFGADGTARFEFKALTGEEFAPDQFVAAFLTVCTPPDSRQGKEGQPISNAAGVLVTVG